MPCALFEDLLLDYTELPEAKRESVDNHVSGCADCREYLETTAQFDAGLLDLYADIHVSSAFQKSVLSRVEAVIPLSPPSMLPEALDFIGWAGMIIALVCLVPMLPHFWLEFNTVVAPCAAATISAAVWAGLRSYADLTG
jgi:hypothetical protein